MAGYTRNDTSNNIATGNVINAADLDGEFDALVAAFHASTGHTHDGTAANGAPITKIGPAQDLVISTGAITPKTDNTVDLGSSSFEFKDLYIDGTANIDALVADTADINAGTIDGVTLGTNSAVTEAQIDNININGNTISSTDTNGNISLVPNGTGDVILTADTIQIGDSNTDVTVTTNGTGDLIFNTNAGTNSGVIRIYDGANGNIALTPNGTGEVDISKVDIDGGAIDGTTIGGSTAAAGSFTTLTTSSTVTLNGGTANGVLYLNGSKVATSGSALTFTGSVLGVNNSGDSDFKLTTSNTGSGSTDGLLLRINSTGSEAYLWNWEPSSVLIFGANGSEQMRLTSTGLGIGTSSPAYKLDVDATSSANAIQANSNNLTYGVSINLKYNGTAIGQIGSSKGIDSTGNLTDLAFNSAANLDFATGYTRRMRLDSSGNLGLGVTPSAWSSYKALQVNTTGVFSNVSGTTRVGDNFYYDGSNYKYLTSSYASMVQYNGGGGGFAWFNAPSGTAGNAITFTQAMTLDASGNLIVGATSASHRLHVERNWNGSTWIITVNTDSGAGAAAGMLFKNNTGELGAISLLSSANSPADSLFLRSLSTNPLAFGTNNTERARITSGGYFKASNSGTYLDSTGSFHELASDDSDDAVAVLKLTNASYTGPGAFVDISRNTTNNTFYAISYFNRGASAYKFRVADSGDVTNTNGTYGTISDAKMKTDIVDAGSQWADIKAIRFRKFKMKNDPSELVQLGVVAQELEQTSPGLVDEHVDRDAEGNDLGTTTKSVKTSILLMKAAKALQEAMARIETLEAKVSALEGN